MTSIGLKDFPLTSACLEYGITQQLHTCAQVYISQYGDCLADFAVGQISDKRNCSVNTVMPWMSCSKMITASAFAILTERRLVDWDTPVKEIIPAFGCNGKENITFTHILNHTAGIRLLSVKWDDISWDESIDAICEMPVEDGWSIGVDGGYHIGTSWFILGEAVQRISGKKLGDFVQKEIFSPLAMNNCWLAMPQEVYNNPTLDMAHFYRTDKVPIKLALDKYAHAPNRCRPGASCRGPMSELGHFMEMLYEGGSKGHARILSSNTVEKMTAVSRQGVIDRTFNKKIDWGLGFMLDSKGYQEDYPYSFGPGCSDETFGHNGNQSSAAYVDGYHELVICFALNGLPGEVAHQKRLKEINSAIYRDLKIL